MLETDLSIIDCGDNTFKIQLDNIEIIMVNNFSQIYDGLFK